MTSSLHIAVEDETEAPGISVCWSAFSISETPPPTNASGKKRGGVFRCVRILGKAGEGSGTGRSHKNSDWGMPSRCIDDAPEYRSRKDATIELFDGTPQGNVFSGCISCIQVEENVAS